MMSGVRLRERGCKSLQLLPGMPIRHRRIEEKDQGSEETGGFSPAGPQAQQSSGANRACPASLPVPFFTHNIPRLTLA